MRKGLIPLDVHDALEPIVAIVLIAAPWIFGFIEPEASRRSGVSTAR
jgi:hypothetical protein